MNKIKKYRILQITFDLRVRTLELVIEEDWDEDVKILHKANKENLIKRLALEYGELYLEEKIKNFKDLGALDMSIIAYHNNFLLDCRNAFVIGSYYPALTGACALGERILNQLLLTLSDYYKCSDRYREVFRKKSFDDWTKSIDILSEWEVLLPEVTIAFKNLATLRNSSIHYQDKVEYLDREMALDALKLIQNIVKLQFGSYGNQPWIYRGVLGEVYIKSEWTSNPFVKEFFLPNSCLVGYKHHLDFDGYNWTVIDDEFEYEKIEISDEEYASLRILHTS